MTDSRARMVRSAAALIGARGLSATSFAELIDASGAPRGSIYHHFPEGKRQLAAAAIDWTCEQVLAHQRACTATSAHGVLDHFVALWRDAVARSGVKAGCAVAGVALDAGGEAEELRERAGAAFARWIELLTAQLEAVGLERDRARSLALAAVAAMEGALVLCRAAGDVEPLEAAAAELGRALASGPA